MKIIEYEDKYLEEVKDLLVELEEYILSIDEDNLDQLHPEYRDKMAILDLEEVKENNGKCYLAIDNNAVVGLIMGCLRSYDEYDYLDYKCPRCGEVTELIVSKKTRSKGIGSLLMNKMEEYFKKPVTEIREELANVIRDQGTVQEVQRNLVKDVKTTPAEVRKFYNQLPADSIPYIPMQVEVQIITLNPKVPQQEIDNVKARLRDFSEQVNKGERDFSTLAVLYSEDRGSAMMGGEMGFVSKSNLVPEFANVAFNLNDPKKVSKIVETEYGYHIIQLIEKRGDRINVRHILLRPHVSEKDISDALVRLDSLRVDLIDKKISFDEITQYVSQDKDTRNNKGLMVNPQTGNSKFEMGQLPQDVAKVVADLKVGEISKPFVMTDERKNKEVVAIVKLKNRIDGHKANMSDDYQTLKAIVEEKKKTDILNEWLAKKQSETYIRIKEGWRNCEFKYDGWIKK